MMDVARWKSQSQDLEDCHSSEGVLESVTEERDLGLGRDAVERLDGQCLEDWFHPDREALKHRDVLKS